MCRLFAFRSVIPSAVHTSLIGAQNALLHQSTMHPDGWGVAYYQGGCPHLMKSTVSAVDDRLFEHVSGVVSSHTVIAHLRRATLGEISVLNTHPFQYGRWTFAHNGNIAGFPHHRDRFKQEIPPDLRRFILGNTDSETLFFLILAALAQKADIHDPEVALSSVFSAVRETLSFVSSYSPYQGVLDGPADHTYLSFVLTNGQCLLAHNGGQTLFVSTHKTRCSVRGTCPHLSASCENPTPRIGGSKVNHLIIASEPTQGENVWEPLKLGDLVGADAHLAVHWDSFSYGTKALA